MNRKLCSLILIAMLCLSLAVPVMAAEGWVYDEADLITDRKEAELSRTLEEVSGLYGARIVIATVPAVSGSVDAYVNEWYDTRDIGKDGVLLLVCMDPREYRILSNGFPADAIGMDEIDAIGEAIVSDLSGGDYAAAFDTFAEECGYYLNGYLNGFPFDYGLSLAVALAIGIVSGVITACVLKGQLKTVRRQNEAENYVKPGSMQLTAHSDLFLYRNVSRTKKASDGGSSGSSRNVGGGSF